MEQDELSEKLLKRVTIEEFVDWLIKYKGCNSDHSQRENIIINLREQIDRHIMADRLIRPTIIVNNYFSLFGKKNVSTTSTL